MFPHWTGKGKSKEKKNQGTEVCVHRRSWLKAGFHHDLPGAQEGGNRGANGKAAFSTTLYNSVSQGLSDATTKFSQLGQFQWTIGFPKPCVQIAHTHHFFTAILLCALHNKRNPSVDFVYSGGLLSPWAPDRRLRVFCPTFPDLWAATRTPRILLLSPSLRWRTWATTADRRPTAIMNIIPVSRTDSPWTLTTTSLIWMGWELLERIPPNLNTPTQTPTDSTDITTEITCRHRLPTQVNVEIITGNFTAYCLSALCMMLSTR